MSLRFLCAGCVAVATVLSCALFAQEPTRGDVLPPARPGLQAVVFPSAEPLEQAVADHIRNARREFEQASANASTRDLAEAYGVLGRVFHAYEFFEAAEACYRNATELRRSDVRWLHLRAYLYQQVGRFEEAVDLYLAARRAASDNHAATVHLGEAYLGLGRIADARDQFELALPRFPGAANAGLGDVALRERRYRDAVDHFEAALQRIPDATAIHYSLAMAYRGLGRLDDARSHLERRGSGGARVVDPIVDVLPTLVRGERAFVMQGRRAYDAGQFQAAAEAFRKAVDAAPDSATPRVNLALALSQLGNTAAALDQFEAALRLEPDNPTAHAGKGTLLARLGRDAEAVGHLRTAFQQAPGDGQVSGELVAVLLRLARTRDAIEVLTQTRAIDPDEEQTLVSLSILLADAERYKDALTLLEDGHRRFPDRAATATTLARLLAASPDRSVRDGRRALDLAMTVYAGTPTPAYAETVALALAELERCDEAADWMRRAIADAERVKNTAESARLKSEAGRYAKRPCRP